MSDGRNGINASRPPLDVVDQRVRSIIYTAAARAYDYRPIDDEAIAGPSCTTCRGDGCASCNHTGDAPQ